MWCQARLLGPDLEKRKREIKPRFIQSLGPESVLSNAGSASILLCFSVPCTPKAGSRWFWEQPSFKQGRAVWCLSGGCRAARGGGSLCPRGGLSVPHRQHILKARWQDWAPCRPPRAHYRNINPSGGCSGAAVEKGIEGFQKTVRQVQIFLYPYRAGSSREERWEGDLEPALRLGFSVFEDCKRWVPRVSPLWVRNRGRERCSLRGEGVCLERVSCDTVHLSMRRGDQGKGGILATHAVLSTSWRCTQCHNSREVPEGKFHRVHPLDPFLSRLALEASASSPSWASWRERFPSPASFSHPHSSSMQTQFPFSPFPYLFAPKVSILLGLPAELPVSHFWQQEPSWQRPKLILLQPSQVIALKTNWGGFLWAGQIDR